MTFWKTVALIYRRSLDFGSRSSLREFRLFEWFAYPTCAVGLGLFFALDAVGQGEIGGAVFAALWLLVIIPSPAVGARRLHDLDLPGWVELRGARYGWRMMRDEGVPWANQWGPPPGGDPSTFPQSGAPSAG